MMAIQGITLKSLTDPTLGAANRGGQMTTAQNTPKKAKTAKRAKKTVPFEEKVLITNVEKAKTKGPQGCSSGLIKLLLTVSLISLGAALLIGLPRVEAQCRIGNYQEIPGLFNTTLKKTTLHLYAGNDRTWEAVAWQTASPAVQPVVTVVEPGPAAATVEPRSACWYNPLLPYLATLDPRSLIYPLLFWLLLSLALPTGGIGLAGWIWNPSGPTSAGQRLAVRLHAEGNQNPWMGIQFNLLLALTLSSILWPLWLAAAWLPRDFGSQINLKLEPCLFMLSILLGAAALFVLYQGFRQLRLAFLKRGITVELSAHPLQPGQTAQLWLEYQAGHSAIRRTQVKLVCRQTVEEPYTTRKGETRYRNRTFVIYEANIGEGESLIPSWEHPLSLTIPPEAQPTLKQPLYDPIGWAVLVRLQRANAPDIELDFPFEVVK